MTIRPAVLQADVREKDLYLWNIGLITFQNGINEVTHFVLKRDNDALL